MTVSTNNTKETQVFGDVSVFLLLARETQTNPAQGAAPLPGLPARPVGSPPSGS